MLISVNHTNVSGDYSSRTPKIPTFLLTLVLCFLFMTQVIYVRLKGITLDNG